MFRVTRMGYNNLLYALTRTPNRPADVLKVCEEGLKLIPDSGRLNNCLAWLRAHSPDLKYRDPGEAVQRAKKAVKKEPDNGSYWNTLGTAYYRAGDWEAAAEALEKAVSLRKGGDSFDFFFQAMSYWKLDRKVAARKEYDRAVQWMQKNLPNNEELRRFRAEAAELLGIEKKKGK